MCTVISWYIPRLGKFIWSEYMTSPGISFAYYTNLNISETWWDIDLVRTLLFHWCKVYLDIISKAKNVLYLTARGHLRSRGAHRTPYRTRRASNTLPHAARIEHLAARGAHWTPCRTRRASNTLPQATRIEHLTARIEQFTKRGAHRMSSSRRGTTVLSPATLSRFSLLHVFVQLQNRMEENSVCEYRYIYTCWAVTTCISSTGRDCTNL